VQGVLDAQSRLRITAQGESVSVKLQLPGQHNALNALAATAAALGLGVELEVVKQGLESLQPVKGRLNPKTGAWGGLLIDDTYNANPSSTAAAVEVLAGLQGRKILVLGDMGELGMTGEQLHFALGQQAANSGIDAVYGLGTLSARTCEAFGQPQHAFTELDALLETLRPELQAGTQVLVKGSRSARMERVVDALLEAPAKEAA